MALEFMDSFDHYTSNTMFLRKWNAASAFDGGYSPLGTAGRFGGLCLKIHWGSTAARLFAAELGSAVTTRVIGFAASFASPQVAASSAFFAFQDSSGNNLVELRWSAAGITINRGSTVLATSSSTLSANTWYYFEFKVTVSTTAGSVSLRRDGTVVASASGVNTSASGASQTERLAFLGINDNSADYLIDDLYVLNTSGSLNTDFLGECRIFMVLPNADSSTVQWTPSTGTAHWSLVDESNPNDDTDYVSSSTVGHIDLYGYPDITSTGSVKGVQVTLTARKDDVGTRAIASECKSSSTSNTGATIPLTTSYAMYRQIRETDPNTGVAWTVSGFNAAEFGAKVIT